VSMRKRKKRCTMRMKKKRAWKKRAVYSDD
jgi:hypothetical protein